ncbi:MAG: DJ-1 family glyoxalase III [Ruminococcus sp.]
MVYVFLADGFEETEAIAPIDMLRRAGKKVVTVGVTGKIVTGSHGIQVTADITENELSDISGAEMIVLPGGMPGTLNEEKSAAVQSVISYCSSKNIPVGAICAAPSILGHKGLLEGKKAVCYTGFEKDLKGAVIGTEAVVTDGNITTARGAGAAIEFGLELVRVLCGEAESDRIRASILFG